MSVKKEVDVSKYTSTSFFIGISLEEFGFFPYDFRQ